MICFAPCAWSLFPCSAVRDLKAQFQVQFLALVAFCGCIWLHILTASEKIAPTFLLLQVVRIICMWQNDAPSSLSKNPECRWCCVSVDLEKPNPMFVTVSILHAVHLAIEEQTLEAYKKVSVPRILALVFKQCCDLWKLRESAAS